MSITFGAEAEFLSAGDAYYISVAALSSTAFVVAYYDAADSGHGTAKVGAVSGTTISFGAEAEFSASSNSISVAALGADKFVVAYHNGVSGHGAAKVGTVSGTGITFGAEAEFQGVAGGVGYVSAAALSGTQFVVAYRDYADSGHGTAKIGTVSGTAITFGAEAEFLSANGAQYVSAAALSSTAFVVAYRDAADSDHGTAKIGTVSGTAIAFGAEAEFLSAVGQATYISAVALSSTTFVVAYADGSDSNHGTAKVGTVSGTAITFGAEAEFLSASLATYNSVTALSATEFAVAYADAADSFHGTAKVGAVSGTAITFGAETEFLSANGASYNSVAALSARQFAVAYADNADSSHGTAKLGSLPAVWTANASDSVSLADAAVRTVGIHMSDTVALADEITVAYSHAVAVASDPSGVPVSASTDENGYGDGTTPFSRRYADGAGITLTAPAKSGDRVFLEWRDGGGNTLSSFRALGVTVAAGAYTAHYEFAGDSADDYLVASP